MWLIHKSHVMRILPFNTGQLYIWFRVSSNQTRGKLDQSENQKPSWELQSQSPPSKENQKQKQKNRAQMLLVAASCIYLSSSTNLFLPRAKTQNCMEQTTHTEERGNTYCSPSLLATWSHRPLAAKAGLWMTQLPLGSFPSSREN